MSLSSNTPNLNNKTSLNPTASRSVELNQALRESQIIISSLEKLNHSYGFLLTPGKFYEDTKSRSQLSLIKSQIAEAENKLEILAKRFPNEINLEELKDRFSKSKQQGVLDWGEFSSKQKQEQTKSIEEQKRNESQLVQIWKTALLACGHTVEAADVFFIGGAKALFTLLTKIYDPKASAVDTWANHILEKQDYYNTQWGSALGTKEDFAKMNLFEATINLNFVCHFGSAVISPVLQTANYSYDFYCMKVTNWNGSYQDFKVFQQQDSLLRLGKNAFNIAEICAALACIGKLHGASTYQELLAPLKVGSIFGTVGALGNELAAEDDMSFHRFVDNFLDQMAGSLLCNFILGSVASKYSNFKLGKTFSLSPEKLKSLSPAEFSKILKVRELSQQTTSAIDFIDAQNDLKEASVELSKELLKHEWSWKSIQELDWRKGRKILGKSMLTGLSGYDAFDYNSSVPNNQTSNSKNTSFQELSLVDKNSQLNAILQIPELKIISTPKSALEYFHVELNGIYGQLRYSTNGAVFVKDSPLLFQEIIRIDLEEKIKAESKLAELSNEETKKLARRKSLIAKSYINRLGFIISPAIDINQSRENRIEIASNIFHEYTHLSTNDIIDATEKEETAYTAQLDFINKATEGEFRYDLNSGKLVPNSTPINYTTEVRRHLVNSLGPDNVYLALSTIEEDPFKNQLSEYKKKINTWLSEENTVLENEFNFSKKNLKQITMSDISTFSALAFMICDLFEIDHEKIKFLIISLELVNLADINIIFGNNNSPTNRTKILEAESSILKVFQYLSSKGEQVYAISNWINLLSIGLQKRNSLQKETLFSKDNKLPTSAAKFDTSLIQTAIYGSLAVLQTALNEQQATAIKEFYTALEQSLSYCSDFVRTSHSGHFNISARSLTTIDFPASFRQASNKLGIFGSKAEGISQFLQDIASKVNTVSKVDFPETQEQNNPNTSGATTSHKRQLAYLEESLIQEIQRITNSNHSKGKKFQKLISLWHKEKRQEGASINTIPLLFAQIRKFADEDVIQAVDENNLSSLSSSVKTAITEISDYISKMKLSGQNLAYAISATSIILSRSVRKGLLKKVKNCLDYIEPWQVPLILHGFILENIHNNEIFNSIFNLSVGQNAFNDIKVSFQFLRYCSNFNLRDERVIKFAKDHCNQLVDEYKSKKKDVVLAQVISFLYHFTVLDEVAYIKSILDETQNLEKHLLPRNKSLLLRFLTCHLVTYKSLPEKINLADLELFNRNHTKSPEETEIFNILKKLFSRMPHLEIQHNYPELPFADDIRITATSTSNPENKKIIVIEFDGLLYHYVNGDPDQGFLGTTALKDRLYKEKGIIILRVLSSTWNTLKTSEAKEKFISTLLLSIKDTETLDILFNRSSSKPQEAINETIPIAKIADEKEKNVPKQKKPKTAKLPSPILIDTPAPVVELPNPVPTTPIPAPRKTAHEMFGVKPEYIMPMTREDFSILEPRLTAEEHNNPANNNEPLMIAAQVQTKIAYLQTLLASSFEGTNNCIFLKHKNNALGYSGCIYAETVQQHGQEVMLISYAAKDGCDYHRDHHKLFQGFVAAYWERFFADSQYTFENPMLGIFAFNNNSKLITEITKSFEEIIRNYNLNLIVQIENSRFIKTQYGKKVFQYTIRIVPESEKNTPFFPNKVEEKITFEPSTEISTQHASEVKHTVEESSEIDPQEKIRLEIDRIIADAQHLTPSENGLKAIPILLSKIEEGNLAELKSEFLKLDYNDRIAIFSNDQLFLKFISFIIFYITEKDFSDVGTMLSFVFNGTITKRLLLEAMIIFGHRNTKEPWQNKLEKKRKLDSMLELKSTINKTKFLEVSNLIAQDPSEESYWKRLRSLGNSHGDYIIILTKTTDYISILISCGEYKKALELRQRLIAELETHRQNIIKKQQEDTNALATLMNQIRDLKKKTQTESIRGQIAKKEAKKKELRERIVSKDDPNLTQAEYDCNKIDALLGIINFEENNALSTIALEKGLEECKSFYETYNNSSSDMRYSIFCKLLNENFQLSKEESEFLYVENNLIISQTLVLFLLSGNLDAFINTTNSLYVSGTMIAHVVEKTITQIITYQGESKLKEFLRKINIPKSMLFDIFLKTFATARNMDLPLMAAHIKGVLMPILESYPENMEGQISSFKEIDLTKIEHFPPTDSHLLEEEVFLNTLLFPSTGVFGSEHESLDLAVDFSLDDEGFFHTNEELAARRTEISPINLIKNLSTKDILKIWDVRFCVLRHPKIVQSAQEVYEIIAERKNAIIAEKDFSIQPFNEHTPDNYKELIAEILFCNLISLYLQKKYGVEISDQEAIAKQIDDLLKILPPKEQWHEDTIEYFNVLTSLDETP